MAGSPDERELRDAVTARLRKLLPSARIVHELNTAGQGSYRMDLAAITRDQIIAVEIKSKRDKLDRLSHQIEAFNACAHLCIVAAHRKHFVNYESKYERRADYPQTLVLNHPLGDTRQMLDRVWCYPFDTEFKLENQFENSREWSFPRNWHQRFPPAPVPLLRMLWAAELKSECSRHRIVTSARSTIASMITDMANLMTGREIVHAVCRQLRSRNFAEADAPIIDERIAA